MASERRAARRFHARKQNANYHLAFGRALCQSRMCAPPLHSFFENSTFPGRNRRRTSSRGPCRGQRVRQSSREGFWTFGSAKKFPEVQKSKRDLLRQSRFRTTNAEQKNACQNRGRRLLDRFYWGPPLRRASQNSPARGAAKNRPLTACFRGALSCPSARPRSPQRPFSRGR